MVDPSEYKYMFISSNNSYDQMQFYFDVMVFWD